MSKSFRRVKEVMEGNGMRRFMFMIMVLIFIIPTLVVVQAKLHSHPPSFIFPSGFPLALLSSPQSDALNVEKLSKSKPLCYVMWATKCVQFQRNDILFDKNCYHHCVGYKSKLRG